MKHLHPGFSQIYHSALRTHLAHKSRPDMEAIGKTGDHARAAGLPMLEIAKIHERFLIMDLLPGCADGKRASLIRNAGNFFAAVTDAAGMEKHGAPDTARLSKTIQSLSGRTVELADANRLLGLEIIQCRKVVTALRISERLGVKALEKSEALKEQLRELSRRILSVQAEERKKISHELHDVIAQELFKINVRLATLKTEAGINIKGLDRNISISQKIVRKSADTVHKFARELHPATLDDLGLIPALHSFMKSFTIRTGVHTHLTAFEGIENISAVKRNVLYRVAQEALTNVARHAHASRADVIIRKEATLVTMEVSDDGKSFQSEPDQEHATERLGLLGMSERVEMVGGTFEIKSERGEGTKIIARIPVSRNTQRKWRKQSMENQPEKR